MMKPRLRLWTIGALMSPAMLLLTVSCSNNSTKTPAAAAKEETAAPQQASAMSKNKSSGAGIYQRGVPGGIEVETHDVTARVTAVDSASRTVTLATSDGST